VKFKCSGECVSSERGESPKCPLLCFQHTQVDATPPRSLQSRLSHFSWQYHEKYTTSGLVRYVLDLTCPKICEYALTTESGTDLVTAYWRACPTCLQEQKLSETHFTSYHGAVKRFGCFSVRKATTTCQYEHPVLTPFRPTEELVNRLLD
jgi:hypothetical protein